MNTRRVAALVFALLVSLCMVSCGTRKPETVYEYGTFDQSIEEVFDIQEDTKKETAIAGQTTNFSPVVVNSAQTEDGGWVAWDDGKYAYTAEDVGSSSVCGRFVTYYY